MKKILSFLLTVIATLTLCSCGNQNKRDVYQFKSNVTAKEAVENALRITTDERIKMMNYEKFGSLLVSVDLDEQDLTKKIQQIKNDQYKKQAEKNSEIASLESEFAQKKQKEIEKFQGGKDGRLIMFELSANAKYDAEKELLKISTQKLSETKIESKKIEGKTVQFLKLNLGFEKQGLSDNPKLRELQKQTELSGLISINESVLYVLKNNAPILNGSKDIRIKISADSARKVDGKLMIGLVGRLVSPYKEETSEFMRLDGFRNAHITKSSIYAEIAKVIIYNSETNEIYFESK